jgi:prolyl-tRNA synthetase
MRYSQLFIPTVKEAPADAETVSHKLLVRAGFMRKLASGTYTYLPLGWKCLRKIMDIIRDEMNAGGAQEISMPILQPMELWEKTGRDKDYGPTMCKFQDRHGRINALAPTAEEVVTTLVAGEINSYKQLPVNFYQINTKFRDEFRPRFGVLRSREFIMKDAYSFHASVDDLETTYNRMYEAYRRIFARCGLKYTAVEAESGPIGGSASHEFMVPCSAGEDIIVHTNDFSYAANIEKAEVDPLGQNEGRGTMDEGRCCPSPEEVHTPNVGSIDAVCEFLKTKPQDMIKTLIYSRGKETIVVLVRGDHEVNEAKLMHLAGVGVELAGEAAIQTITGAAVGFAGPMGLDRKIAKLVIDHAVAAMKAGITGANKTDYHVRNIIPGRDFPLQGDNVVVADVRNAAEGDTFGGKKLYFSQGIEVGHVFKLGTKYSEKLGAKYLDQTGVEKPCIMGCYGIGVNRILASAIELGNDKDGIIWPISIAPFEVIVTCVNQEDTEVAKAAENIYQQLLDKGIDVLLDDRIMRGGGKFKDADLLGVPVRITVGKKSIAEGNVEIKLRGQADNQQIKIEQALIQVTELVKQLNGHLESA